MAGVAQLVRAPGCGSGGRGFETRHSPHWFCFLMLLLVLAACEEEKKAPPRTVDYKLSPSVVDEIITDVPRAVKYKKPDVSIIVDHFCMREDVSAELLAKLPSSTILCVPSHCILRDNLVERAQEYGYTLAISIDYLNSDQWPILQKVIEQHSWIKGVVIWCIDNDFKFENIEEWLSYRGIWIVYVNANDFIYTKNHPKKIIISDGFVKLSDDTNCIRNQLNFVLDQAKFSNFGLIVVQPSVQHVAPLIDWLQDNSQNMQLVKPR